MPTEVLRIDPAAEREQVERLRALRERRDRSAPPPPSATSPPPPGEDRNLMPADPRLRPRRGHARARSRTRCGEVYGEYREAGLE